MTQDSRLHALLAEVHLPVPAHLPNGVIRSVCSDSRRVAAGALFVGVPGAQVDGGVFWRDSLARGAAAAVISAVAASRQPPADGDPVVVVDQPAAVLGPLAAATCGHPSRHMQVIGVTGTNGKTTTTHLVEHLSTALGTPTALLGTLANRWPGRTLVATHTTGVADMLQQDLAAARGAGVQRVAMEVSSHALVQGRVAGTRFTAAAFTNLSQDHLDFHPDMEAYYQAKAALFTPAYLAGRAVVNCDDPHGRRLRRYLGAAAWGCRLVEHHGQHHGDAELIVTDVSMGSSGAEGRLVTPCGEARFRSPLVGRFNLMNLLQALGTLLACGLPLQPLLEPLTRFPGVPGRMQRIPAASITVVVDYAHTPDGLASALNALRPFATGRLVCVFGCGGDRDRGKRPQMAAVAAQLADQLVVTSDNPRTEDPAQILQHIQAGIPPGTPHVVEPDRGRAIARAVLEAAPGDTVLIAGKGHETYQIVGTEKRPFDDAHHAARAVAQR